MRPTHICITREHSNRSCKLYSLRKLNDNFVLDFLEVVRPKLMDFEPRDLAALSVAAWRPGLKKREVKRQLFAFNLEAMKVIAQAANHMKNLAQEAETLNLPENKELWLNSLKELRGNYFELYRVSKTLILKEEMKKYSKFNVEL